MNRSGFWARMESQTVKGRSSLWQEPNAMRARGWSGVGSGARSSARATTRVRAASRQVAETFHDRTANPPDDAHYRQCGCRVVLGAAILGASGDETQDADGDDNGVSHDGAGRAG